MSHHSVVDAKNNLSELIDRALKGEDVVITRHGTPVVELKAVPRIAKPVSHESLDWLAKRRASRPAVKVDSGMLMSRLRDDEWKL